MIYHVCAECGGFMEQHDEDCLVDGCPGHWPPLCCPGCDCQSFEEAHPEVPRESVADMGQIAEEGP